MVFGKTGKLIRTEDYWWISKGQETNSERDDDSDTDTDAEGSNVESKPESNVESKPDKMVTPNRKKKGKKVVTDIAILSDNNSNNDPEDSLDTPKAAKSNKSNITKENIILEKRERKEISYEECDFAFSCHQLDDQIPRTYKEAMSSELKDKWKAAIMEELTSVIGNNTWKVVKRVLGVKLLPYRWIFAIKRGKTGLVERYKARLVIGGHKQEAGIDYNQVFAAVARYQTIRMLLAVATVLDYEVKQIDYTTAFLNGDLEEDVYMKTPDGINLVNLTVESDEMLKLTRALYGLKQAPRQWKNKVDIMMKKLGFTQSKTDNAVYFKDGCIVAVYVDDLMIVGKNVQITEKEEAQLLKAYKGKSLGNLEMYLGMNWIRDRANRKSWLQQSLFCEKVLKRFDMQDCDPTETPIALTFKTDQNDENYNVKRYQEAVGSLIYLMTGTRPDIAYAVSVASRAMAKPLLCHWKLVKRIFRYLKGTVNYGLQFGGKIQLEGYADADWGMDEETRRSTTGFIFFFGGPISWKSMLQKTVALSSTEAEFMSLVSEIQEGMWLLSLIQEMGIDVKKPIVLMEDNQGCIALANNPTQHGRTKHIDVKYFFIREKIADGSFMLHYCQTDAMVADLLTKSLGVKQFKKLREKIGVVDIGSRGVFNVGIVGSNSGMMDDVDMVEDDTHMMEDGE
jgi:hypothetical protein